MNFGKRIPVHVVGVRREADPFIVDGYGTLEGALWDVDHSERGDSTVTRQKLARRTVPRTTHLFFGILLNWSHCSGLQYIYGE